jgi:polyisoprenoid-binding protein YceI
MKKTLFQKLAISAAIFFIAALSTSNQLAAQTVFQVQVMEITLKGTSNVHDWEMKAIKGESEIRFVVDANNKVSSLTRLNFKLLVKNLKSKHTGMDKNTYKALNTDKNPNIIFTLTSATMTATAVNSYQFNCIGNLTIAGVTKQTTLLAVVKYNPSDKTFRITGSKKMNMSDYNVKPPTAVFGTIKTGNPITISYDLKFKK